MCTSIYFNNHYQNTHYESLHSKLPSCIIALERPLRFTLIKRKYKFLISIYDISII